MSFIASLALAWNKYVEPLYNWIPANIQALWYIKSRSRGRKTLAVLEQTAPNFKSIVTYLSVSGWKWQSDPLGGALDFTSKPWVICAKKGGDCDDFARLWHHLLKPHGKVEYVITAKKYSFHEMMIFTQGDMCYLFSNLKLLKVSAVVRKDVFDKEFYGEDTWFTAVY